MLYLQANQRGNNMLIIPGANHVDLYDNLNVIPFNRIEGFLKKTFEKK
jgi:hypothetical protein